MTRQTPSRTVRLPPSAQSAIEVDVLDGADAEHDPPGFAAIRSCYTDGQLSVPSDPEQVALLRQGLLDLSDGYSDAAASRHTPRLDAEQRRFADAAASALSTAAERVSKASRSA